MKAGTRLLKTKDGGKHVVKVSTLEDAKRNHAVVRGRSSDGGSTLAQWSNVILKTKDQVGVVASARQRLAPSEPGAYVVSESYPGYRYHIRSISPEHPAHEKNFLPNTVFGLCGKEVRWDVHSPLPKQEVGTSWWDKPQRGEAVCTKCLEVYRAALAHAGPLETILALLPQLSKQQLQEMRMVTLDAYHERLNEEAREQMVRFPIGSDVYCQIGGPERVRMKVHAYEVPEKSGTLNEVPRLAYAVLAAPATLKNRYLKRGEKIRVGLSELHEKPS